MSSCFFVITAVGKVVVVLSSNKNALSDAAIEWFEERGISAETAVRFGCYTANVTTTRRATVVAFPYIESGVKVNEKFRQLPKEKFWQERGGKTIFWNADALDDPALEDGSQKLVITEGEVDALTAIQCGFPLTVSVPDGAPPVARTRRDPEENDGAEQTGKFEFIYEARDKIARIKKFILAVDNDPPGQRLADELVRRLMAIRCEFVTYPAGCKDLNDVLVKHGPQVVTAVLNSAKPYPVHGLYRLSDYPQQEKVATYSSGWDLLDYHFTPFLGEFVVVTGIPGHGKTSWALHLLANLATLHGFRAAMFSPEMSIVPAVRDRLRCIRTKKAIDAAANPDVDAWIEDNFVFIGPDPTGAVTEDEFNLDWIIEKAVSAVMRFGVRVLLIDPWNEVEHAIPKGMSMTQYIGDSIRKLRALAKARGLIVIVVAHPTKLEKKNGKLEAPSLYDISDSAHWFNKCDHGIVVHRGDETNNASVTIVKSRFDEAGERGGVLMEYDRITRRFGPLTPKEG